MENRPTCDAAERVALADNALATMRLEGLEPPAEARELIDTYVSGAISEDELFDAIERLLGSR